MTVFFQTPSLPGEAPRRPCEGLAKAESTHTAPRTISEEALLSRAAARLQKKADKQRRQSAALADAISKSSSSSSSSSASSSSDKD